MLWCSLKVLSSFKIPFCVMGMLISQFVEFGDPAGEACFWSCFANIICSSIHDFFNVMVLGMDTQIGIKAGLELHVECIIGEVVRGAL